MSDIIGPIGPENLFIINSINKVLDMHSCKGQDDLNLAEGLKVFVKKEEGSWYLISKSLAMDFDVRAGEADEVGEVMTESYIAIKYCPFCGTHLLDTTS